MKKKQYRYFRIKKYRKNSSDRCYLCGREGHYSKNCPNKRYKAAKLASNVLLQGEANTSDAEIESLFSKKKRMKIAIEDTSSEDEDSSEEIPYIFMASEVPVLRSCKTIQEAMPSPNVEVTILPSKYEHPIKAIGMMEQG